MKTESPSKTEDAGFVFDESLQKNNIQSIINFGETKIKQINKRILANEVKVESMESHTDYEYKDLLREYIEAKKDHKKDLKLFVELCKYDLIIR